MTALHTRLPNYDHEAYVLAVRRQMLAVNPLANERWLRRAKAYPRLQRIKRRAVL
jgi:hypothetical protein